MIIFNEDYKEININPDQIMNTFIRLSSSNSAFPKKKKNKKNQLQQIKLENLLYE